MDETLGATSVDGWAHEWRGVVGPGVSHVTSSLTRWEAGHGLGDLATDSASVTTCVIERLRAAQGCPSALRVLVRLSRRETHEPSGFATWREDDPAWTQLNGYHLAGLRATTILGEGH